MTCKKQIIFYLFVCITIFQLSPVLVLAGQNNNQARILQSASELDYPPFAIVKPDGSADGFSVDLLKAVVKVIDREINITVGPWHEIKQQLADGKLDVLPLVAHTKERDKIYDFTVPYLQMHGTIFVRRGEESIRTEEDLKDKEVLVMKGDSSYEYAISRNLTTELFQTDSFEEAFELLSSGKYDAVLCQYLMGLQLIKKLNIKNVVSVSSDEVDSLKPKSAVLSEFEQRFCFAVPEGNKELLASLNEGLAIVFADGTYENLYIKWFKAILPKPAVPVSVVIKYVFSILVPLLLLVAALGIWYLRHKVATKTESLRNEIETRRKVEIALGESHATIKQILNTLPQFVYWKDLEGIYLGCNKVFAKACGLESPELVQGKSDYDMPWPRVSADAYRADDEEVIQKKQVKRNIVKPLRLADGTTLLSECTKIPLRDASGHIIGVLGVSEDITERKKSEEKLRQAQKMESIGTLAGGIAHDFNNILTSIIGFTELALDEAEKDSSIEESLQEVYSAGQRAKELVKQILAFARQSGEENKPVKLRAIAEEITHLLRSSIPSTIRINQQFESDALIMGNPTQLHQIIMNLCTNAAHAMEDVGGQLTISIKDIDADKIPADKQPRPLHGKYVQLQVADNGTGISPDIIDSIFEPYFTTKDTGEGTGMGLAMVQGIVESYGGQIGVESSVGQGTTFTIYLPVTGDRKTSPDYQPEALPTGSERVLFVDDEPQIAKIARIMLEHLGYDVTSRASSTEALELFKARSADFDVVITDMTMPDMTGDKLAIEIMKIRADIPVILCTGYSKRISEETAHDIGIKAFVYKPFLKADLARTVRKVLDERQNQSKLRCT